MGPAYNQVSWSSFKRILSESKNSHRLIYLADVSKQQLQDIVNFIYHGEVKIPEECLKSFMAVSEDLQIKGLLEAFVGEDAEPMTDQYLPNIFTEKEDEAEKNDKAKAQKAIFTVKKSIDSTEKTLTKCPPPFNFVKVEIQDKNTIKCDGGKMSSFETAVDINALIKPMVGRIEMGKHVCLTCRKKFPTKQSVERHAEVHLGLSQQCVVCDKIFNTRNTLATHYTKQHGGELASPWSMK